ncbi:MAG: hypothetical protein K2X73_04745 [Sphingomonas sp.]|uniref:hypothetical protein n=1 Tax=Sphingomonas sp. TaxID=28214 RepID=UPI0025EB0BB7|nr:hypothetical protein [Sphingomonas sp.]MBX9881262.1 hypothetical protein [Sphingomonas sp.]
MITVHVHTPIRGRAKAGDTIELDEATVIALEALGAVARVELQKYQGGAGPADPKEGAAAPASGDAGKVTGGEHTPVAADPGATAAPITAGAAEVSRGGAGTEGAAAPTGKASDKPAVPPAAGRRPRGSGPRAPKVTA